MVYVADVSKQELEDGGVSVEVELEGELRRIAVFLADGELYAVDDVCTHAGASLSDGGVRDRVLRCPRHGAAFDLQTGEVLDVPANPASGSIESYVVYEAADGIAVERTTEG